MQNAIKKIVNAGKTLTRIVKRLLYSRMPLSIFSINFKFSSDFIYTSFIFNQVVSLKTSTSSRRK